MLNDVRDGNDKKNLRERHLVPALFEWCWCVRCFKYLLAVHVEILPSLNDFDTPSTNENEWKSWKKKWSCGSFPRTKFTRSAKKRACMRERERERKLYGVSFRPSLTACKFACVSMIVKAMPLREQKSACVLVCLVESQGESRRLPLGVWIPSS